MGVDPGKQAVNRSEDKLALFFTWLQSGHFHGLSKSVHFNATKLSYFLF